VNPAAGGTVTVPSPTPEHDPDVGETVCGVILALGGLVSLFFGGGAAGVAAIAAGIDLAVNGEEQLNWECLQCQAYWMSQFTWNGLAALHKLTVLGGFQPPYASDLAISAEQSIAFGSNSLSYQSGEATCRSRVLRSMLVPWDGSLIDLATPPPSVSWTNYPTGVAAELPIAPTPVWERAGLWPSAFVDDQSVNPITASITDAPSAYNSGIDGSFGPAVQNAVALIRKPPASLPNWNLDSDRSRGWLTWQLTAPYSTTDVQTEQES
jgi:hypothetical protein